MAYDFWLLHQTDPLGHPRLHHPALHPSSDSASSLSFTTDATVDKFHSCRFWLRRSNASRVFIFNLRRWGLKTRFACEKSLSTTHEVGSNNLVLMYLLPSVLSCTCCGLSARSANDNLALSQLSALLPPPSAVLSCDNKARRNNSSTAPFLRLVRVFSLFDCIFNTAISNCLSWMISLSVPR